MEKRRWLSLLLAGALMTGTAAPALAAPPPDDFGGLAITAPTPSDRRPVTDPAPEDDRGGIAATDPTPSNRRPVTGPAPEDDRGGIAATDPTPSNRRPVTDPAPEDDRGGIAATDPTPSDRRPVTSPAPEDDRGGLASTDPTPSNRRPVTDPAPEDDRGGIAATDPTPSNRKTPTDPAPEDDRGGLAAPVASTKGPIINNQRKDDGLTSGTVSGKGPIINNNQGEEEPAGDPEEPGETLAGIPLETGRHNAYVYGSSGVLPSFRPTQQVTRGEAAVMLYRLLPQDTVLPTGASYSDVPQDAWYAQAAGTLGALGVIRPGEETFLPGEALKRGEFVRYVASFFPLREDADLFSDVPEDDENAPFIRSARAYGWTQGNTDGTFKPDQLLTRAAAVAILNRALGRTPDRAYIDSRHPAFYLDVSPEAWYYYDILEASVTHARTGEGSEERWAAHTPREQLPEPGFQLADGWLVYFDAQQRDLVRNRSVGNFAFNSEGHFTTGNAELDGKLRNIVLTKTNDSMTQEQRLRALYVYVRDSFTYLRRPAYTFGATGFMVKDALDLLNTGYGNCYSYASLFWFLARWIGYDAVIYSGTVGQNKAPHSWVEIAFDGTWYIFDAELEMSYHKRGRMEINLYKFIDAGNSWRYVRPKT